VLVLRLAALAEAGVNWVDCSWFADNSRQVKWQNKSMSNNDRQIVRKTTLAEQGREDDLRNSTIEQRWGMMWQLSVDAWAMKGEDVVNRPMQRDVENVIRGKQH
jgi:hypothetical protein